MRRTITLFIINPSLFLYLVGLSCLIGSDFIISTRFSNEIISEWAEIRSLMGILGIMCLSGLDQALVRSPELSKKILRMIAVQVPTVAVIVAAIVNYIGYLSGYAHAYLLSIGAAGGAALFQYFRSHHIRFISQVSYQGWRIASLLIILYFLIIEKNPSIELYIISTIVAVNIFTALFVIKYPPSKMKTQGDAPAREIYRISFRFMLTSAFLAFSIYAEQLVVQGVGSVEQAASYFAQSTYFLFPAAMVNSYLAFVLGPWIRDNHDLLIKTIKKTWKLILPGIVIYVLALQTIGLVAWHLFSPSVGETDPVLRGLFMMVTIATTLYSLPSAYLGVFAEVRQHDRIIAVQISSLILAACFFLMLWKGGELDVRICVASASLLNWTIRTGYGLFLVRRISTQRLAS